MFRSHSAARTWLVRFPRVRGDVPIATGVGGALTAFSPRARGCSCQATPAPQIVAVFPACAGMFLLILCARQMGPRFPRVRGDVPVRWLYPDHTRGFSPRARGCSQPGRKLALRRCVFPACAGMFPIFPINFAIDNGFPRVRGDVPQSPALTSSPPSFSPRARGCSPIARNRRHPTHVFPACAGMFRTYHGNSRKLDCFPRVRGDVPGYSGPFLSIQSFSPRARGCSQALLSGFTAGHVFPACAGMFPRCFTPICCLSGFPRVRGDVP